MEGTHGGTKVIADTVVERIPEITYADWSQNPDDYCDTYVGWNVWDHPGTRTADCSQLASFYALTILRLNGSGKCPGTGTGGIWGWRTGKHMRATPYY